MVGIMQVERAVRQRRSIRKYSRRPLKNSDLCRILEAGRWAHSGLNNQPWKFKLIMDNRQKKGLAKFTRYSRIIEKAPTALCVFLDKAVAYNREKDIMAVGACIQNMLLQAYELGLGSCWLGEILNRRREAEKFLKIGQDYQLMAVITLGYGDERPDKPRRKSLKSLHL